MATSSRVVRPLLVALVAVAAASARAAPEPAPEAPNVPFTAAIEPDEFATRNAFLASEHLQGRESGTPGGTAAEDYVAGELARLGLEPLGAAGAPFQDVDLPWRPILASDCWVEVRQHDAAPVRVTALEGAVPFGSAPATDVAAGVVFAGYGLTAPEKGYDDWAGLDAAGKVALVLRHGPREDKQDSPWFLRRMDRARMEAMSFDAKTKRAAEAGAVAVLFVNDGHHKDEALRASSGGALPIPAFVIPRATANRILRPLGKELMDLEAAIDRDLVPRSAAVPDVQVALHAVLGEARARNVLFARRGTDPALAGQAVVLSAHLDHVGLGWFGSANGAQGQVHNGADDNASGTSALLEVAESLAAGPAMRRTVVFAGWCGEEKGLVGSEWWCRNPTWPLADVAANVNLDMIGRYRDRADDESGLMVVGIPTGSGFGAHVEAAAAPHALRVTPTWDAWEQSDHFSLYQRKVPVLFLHTGLHPDYHRPGDDWWKLDSKAATRIARFTADLVRRVADDGERPQFSPKPPRAVLGVNLGDEPNDGGARLGQVFPGLAAAAAGLQAGDVIVEAEGQRVRHSADLMRILGARKAGDEIDVTYRRAGAEAKARVKLTAR